MTASRPINGPTKAAAGQYFGVIDIGSNSVRLVVFDGLRRSPQTVFNEKVLCGLGRAVGPTGRMADEAVEAALQTLRRFALLCVDMNVREPEVVATAAVREADNGGAFVERVAQECGFTVRILSGRQEARLSALGVIAGMPRADGVVGDLGGGSLELVRVADGSVHDRVTLPVGPLRLMSGMGDDRAAQRKAIRAALRDIAWLEQATGRDFYVVGGAWRAITRLHIAQTHAPLNVVQGYEVDGREMRRFAKVLARQSTESLQGVAGIPQRRIETLPTAALLLQQILSVLEPPRVVVSALGLREGLLYNRLTPAVRAQDPFVAACQDIAEVSGRFPQHAKRLMTWTDPLFADESEEDLRLRYAACLLADSGWRAHPDHRAERAVSTALFGQFSGVDHRGRGLVALALNQCYGGPPDTELVQLCMRLLNDDDVARAQLIGAALRLGQRLTGGAAKGLDKTRLVMGDDQLLLEVDVRFQDLLGETVTRRLEAVAAVVGLRAGTRTVGRFETAEPDAASRRVESV